MSFHLKSWINDSSDMFANIIIQYCKKKFKKTVQSVLKVKFMALIWV